MSVEDLERVEVDVDRVGVAGEVDQPPDLRLMERREEGGGVLEASSDRAPASEPLLTVRLRFHERDEGLGGGWVGGQLAHGQHGRCAFDLGLLFDERDRADDGAGELVAARPPKVGGEHGWHAVSGAASLCDADSQHLRVGQQAVEVDAAGGRGGDDGAVEGRGGGVPEGELGSGRQVGEVDQEIGALGRCQHETLGRDRHGREEKPALGADLGDSPVIGLAVAGEHKTVGAGVRAVQQAEAVRSRLDVEVRPDRAVDRGEGTEALHHLRIGLVQEIARETAVLVGVEVAVGQQKRELVRRPRGQLELPLALVAHDPETREAGVDVEAGHAHDVVVVPEHRRRWSFG